MTARPDAGRRSAATAALALLAATLWLAANPYAGIEHDARIYTLMAVRWLTPSAYARDPWFAWGSQDQWSVFSPAYARLLELAGVEAGALLATLLAAALFVAAVLYLARTVLPPPAAALAALAVAGVPLCYSGAAMLYVSESFASARGFAVPLSLLAVAATLRRRWPLAGGLHLLALLVHPVMAAGPLAAAALAAMPARTAAAAVAAGVAAFAAVLVAGASGHLPLVDGEWWAFVEDSILVFIGRWVREDPLAVFVAPLLLLVAHRRGLPSLRRLYGCTALVGLLGVLVAVVAGERAPVVLVMQAQLWRVLWFANLLALLAAADLAWRHVLRPGAAWRLATLTLLLPAWGLGGGIGLLGVMLGASHLAPAAAWRRWARLLQPRRRLVAVALVALLLMYLPGFVTALQIASAGLRPRGEVMDALIGLLRSGGWGVLPLLAWALWRRLPGLAAIALAVPLLLLAALSWDQRSPTQRAWEARYTVDGSRRAFADRIARGSTVYWPESAIRVWLELGTAGYAGNTHTTGLIFSRQRAQVLDRRLLRVLLRATDAETVRRLSAQGDLVAALLRGPEGTRRAKAFVLATYEGREATTGYGIRHLCGDPELDFVIDLTRVDGLFVAVEERPAGDRRETLYLYDCRRVRQR